MLRLSIWQAKRAVGIDADLQIVSIAKWIDMETNGWADGVLVSPTGAGNTFASNVATFWIRPTKPNWGEGNYWTTLYRPPEIDALIQQVLKAPTMDAEKPADLALVKLM